MTDLELGPEGVEPEAVVAVAREGTFVRLSSRARETMERSAAIVQEIADSEEHA